MGKKCITTSSLETTGFNYTMSLIQGKYKMFILYTLMEFGVVRFNEMQKYIGTITFKTLSSTLKQLESDGLSSERSTPRSRQRSNTACRNGENPLCRSSTRCAIGETEIDCKGQRFSRPRLRLSDISRPGRPPLGQPRRNDIAPTKAGSHLRSRMASCFLFWIGSNYYLPFTPFFYRPSDESQATAHEMVSAAPGSARHAWSRVFAFFLETRASPTPSTARAPTATAAPAPMLSPLSFCSVAVSGAFSPS